MMFLFLFFFLIFVGVWWFFLHNRSSLWSLMLIFIVLDTSCSTALTHTHTHTHTHPPAQPWHTSTSPLTLHLPPPSHLFLHSLLSPHLLFTSPIYLLVCVCVFTSCVHQRRGKQPRLNQLGLIRMICGIACRLNSSHQPDVTLIDVLMDAVRQSVAPPNIT